MLQQQDVAYLLANTKNKNNYTEKVRYWIKNLCFSKKRKKVTNRLEGVYLF